MKNRAYVFVQCHHDMDQYTGGTTWSNDSLSTRAFEALANPYRRQLLLAMFEKNPQDDDDLDPLRLLEQGGGVDR